MAHTSCKIKHEMAKLYKDISKIQNMLIDQNDVNLQDDFCQKRQELSVFILIICMHYVHLMGMLLQIIWK